MHLGRQRTRHPPSLAVTPAYLRHLLVFRGLRGSRSMHCDGRRSTAMPFSRTWPFIEHLHMNVYVRADGGRRRGNGVEVATLSSVLAFARRCPRLTSSWVCHSMQTGPSSTLSSVMSAMPGRGPWRSSRRLLLLAPRPSGESSASAFECDCSPRHHLCEQPWLPRLQRRGQERGVVDNRQGRRPRSPLCKRKNE